MNQPTRIWGVIVQRKRPAMVARRFGLTIGEMLEYADEL